MRISAYALATKNNKTANFVNLQNLANRIRGSLPTTATGAAKLGAGIGAGVGAVNYLADDDKSLGSLASKVGGGAAIGGAAGYGGSFLRDRLRKRNNSIVTPVPQQQKLLTGTPNVDATPPTNSRVIVTPPPTTSTSSALVGSNQGRTQSGNSAPQNRVNTTAIGAVESESRKVKGVDSSNRPNQSVPVQKSDGTIRGVQSQTGKQTRTQAQSQLLKSYGVDDWRKLPPNAQEMYKGFNKNTSAFANFKIKRYNGFVY